MTSHILSDRFDILQTRNVKQILPWEHIMSKKIRVGTGEGGSIFKIFLVSLRIYNVYPEIIYCNLYPHVLEIPMKSSINWPYCNLIYSRTNYFILQWKKQKKECCKLRISFIFILLL